MESLLKTYTDRENNIFQSEAWQNVQEAQGFKTWWVSCDQGDILVIKKPLRKGKSYIYVPHGPDSNLAGWHVFVKRVREIARSENAVFARIEPLKVPNGALKELKFKKVGKFSPLSRQSSPLNTLLLDISSSEKDILAQMKPKWRYNIRLAERKGVTIRQSQKLEDLKVFYELSVGMKERGFSAFDFDHYQKMMEALAPDNLKLFVAEYEKQTLASLLILFYGSVAIYLHGASGNESRELMPNHLAQWEAIREAKERGCEVYDFWGIAPSDEPDHPWSGITRFKKGFGGEEVQFLGAFDCIFQPFWYRIYFLVNILRKAARR